MSLNNKPHYGVLCPQCRKRMFSYHVHDYKTCGCPNDTMVDGGKEYLRYGWLTEKPAPIKWSKRLDFKDMPDWAKGKKNDKKKPKDRWPY
jgi:hypothetical protein